MYSDPARLDALEMKKKRAEYVWEMDYKEAVKSDVSGWE